MKKKREEKILQQAQVRQAVLYREDLRKKMGVKSNSTERDSFFEIWN